ncbi:MAG: PKD domain-containing protein [Nostocaceae cyanobacterium]|nr:PKD domain-containing protein [Nostocaceae cyanobacterium]
MDMFKRLKIFFVTSLFYSCALFAQPIVTDVVPLAGPTAGGGVIDIQGSGFTSATAVHFGSRSVSTFNVVNDNLITAIAPVGTPETVNIFVTTSAGTSPDTWAASYTYQGDWFAFTTQYATDKVIAIDTQSNAINSITVGASPGSVAINPEGTIAYITVDSNNSVVLIDVATNTVIGSPIPVGTNPQGIAITPDGSSAYVANYGSNNVTPIDLSTTPPTAGTPIPVGLNPLYIAITTDGQKAYVVNTTSSNVTVINLATHTPSPILIPIGPRPVSAITAPNGNRVYVTQVNLNAVTEIDTLTDTVLRTISLTGPGVNAINISSDSNKFYVTNTFDSSITPFNLLTNMAEADIAMDTRPDGISITPDQTRAYIAHEQSNNVVVVDLTLTPPVRTLNVAVANKTGEIAITPDQAPFAYFTLSLASAGSTSVFDASNSLSPVGSIAYYEWDFGDGTIVNTTSPITNHTYATAGVYNVTLVVTNTAGTSTFQIFTGQTVRNNGGSNAIRTQTVTIEANSSPLPPLNFIGVVKKNKFSENRQSVLSATWNGSPSSDVVLYRIYKGYHVIDEVSVGASLEFFTCVPSKHAATEYEIAAVDFNDIESKHVKILVL